MSALAPLHPAAFPPGFRWSTATAAFQVEGARTADGRGRSIWDDAVDTPGRVRDGATADPAADAYRRGGEDVALLSGLGVDRYRFSLSWVRIDPDGDGRPHAAGIDHYSRFVDALLEAGITPFPTLYHWDLPSALEARGGWLSRETAERFAAMVEQVAAALGDRVTSWYTVNEPVSTTLQGYAIGALAPFRTLLFEALPTAHHQLLAHGLAAQALHAHGATEVGIVNNHTLVRPLTDAETDAAAATAYDLLHNRLFADPVLTGAYPDLAGAGIPDLPVRDGDLATIATTCEVYGVNFYNPTTVAAAEGPIPFRIVPTPGAPVTGFGEEWPIEPAALRRVLGDLRDRYPDLPPIAVAENGASFPEASQTAEPLDDLERISYLRGHVDAVAGAIADGVDVREYTVWSLLDNFEWADGYTQRFGLVHVDFDTGERHPKASYGWYRDLIAQVRS